MTKTTILVKTERIWPKFSVILAKTRFWRIRSNTGDIACQARHSRSRLVKGDCGIESPFATKLGSQVGISRPVVALLPDMPHLDEAEMRSVIDNTFREQRLTTFACWAMSYRCARSDMPTCLLDLTEYCFQTSQ